MLIAAIKSIFDIDNVGSRWGVRILYLVTVVLNAAIHFNPWILPLSRAGLWTSITSRNMMLTSIMPL